MKTFKTRAGTELPILNLKGKDYLQVAHRIQWFREEHPDWSIQTSIVSHDEKKSVANAKILDAAGNILATAHKCETAQGFGDHLEKSETGAIGRALALCGYGTQFTTDLEEGERIVDSPLPKGSQLPPLLPYVQPSETRDPGLKKHVFTVPTATKPDDHIINWGRRYVGQKPIDWTKDLQINVRDWLKTQKEKADSEQKTFPQMMQTTLDVLEDLCGIPF